MARRVWLLAVVLAACGGPEPDRDAATGQPDARADAPMGCASAAECDDGVFCNGAERCDPSAPGAARGCVPGEPPCLADQTCDEGAGACLTACDTTGDADGDGHDAIECGGDDCDDADPLRFRGALEVCDAEDRDEDCDPTTFGERDADGDDFVDALCCNVDGGGVRRCGEDCDDRRRGAHPTSVEVCDGVDNDCDGVIDEEVLQDGFVDEDRDLHGDGARPTRACPGQPGFSPVGDDCDDSDPLVHGAQREICNGLDDDCDGELDEGAGAVAWYRDEDGDGFGDPDSTPVMSCGPVAGHRLLATDCDDADPARNPGVEELCNGADDDCDGRADFMIAPGDFEDDDLDGYPDAACASGAVADCDDRDPTVHPGAPEIVDGIDNDCDGTADGACESTAWYVDADRDGWGDESVASVRSCDPQAGRVTRGGDCDDGDPDRNPGMRDVCNGADDDCDGLADADAGRFCAVRHALPVCEDGACAIGACERLWDDCDALVSGCETNIDTSAAHCGACGNLCESGPRGVASCTSGECGLTCVAGFADCDGVASTGCEIDVVEDPLNCGACGITCSARPHASPACDAMTCSIACDAGWADCNGLLADGCETWTAGDRENCGSCGAACAIASDVCVRSACTAPAYPPAAVPTTAFMPTADTLLPAGVHEFTTIVIPAGVTVRTDGDGVLELRATGPVVIRGTIDVSGQHGSAATGGSGGGAGGGGASGWGASTAPAGTSCLSGAMGVGPGLGGRGGAGGEGAGSGTSRCGDGGMFGGGAGGSEATPGGGGGGFAGGSGGSSDGESSVPSAPSGAGASVSGMGRGGPSAALGEGGRGGEAGMLPAELAAYEGDHGVPLVGTGARIAAGGGGGSIGFACAMDLTVTDATFVPGSGGGGGGSRWYLRPYGGGGGGGGGALRISSMVSISVEGTLLASGGNGGSPGPGAGAGGGGSGGAIYVAAPEVRFTSTARVSVAGGSEGRCRAVASAAATAGSAASVSPRCRSSAR
ncbi:MAG: putative metal-binding motif-containing protein [Sandaracinaceae bacterium]|nr:putative metal-binding motif-containing protein [Sandaracinaceae bacterium]